MIVLERKKFSKDKRVFKKMGALDFGEGSGVSRGKEDESSNGEKA